MKISKKQIDMLASKLSKSMFSLLWEGDYSLSDGPGEDELYETLHAALTEIADDHSR